MRNAGWAPDGPHGRVHHGAPATDGRPLRVPADQSGSHQPREPRSQDNRPENLTLWPSDRAHKLYEWGRWRRAPPAVYRSHGRRRGLCRSGVVHHRPARRVHRPTQWADLRHWEQRVPGSRWTCPGHRQAPRRLRHAEFATHLAERREAAGLSRADVSERVVGTRTGACWNWEHHQFPEAKWWPALRDLLDLDEAKWGPIIAEAERQKIGTRTTGIGTGKKRCGSWATVAATSPRHDRRRAAVGELGHGAQTFVLKVVCAVKPVPALAGNRLTPRRGWSSHADHLPAVRCRVPHLPSRLARGRGPASAPASATTGARPPRDNPAGAAGGSSAATATSASELTGATFWNTVTSWKACWAELCEATSTSTTGTTSSTTTDLETLWSCLSQITPRAPRRTRRVPMVCRPLWELWTRCSPPPC